MRALYTRIQMIIFYVRSGKTWTPWWFKTRDMQTVGKKNRKKNSMKSKITYLQCYRHVAAVGHRHRITHITTCLCVHTDDVARCLSLKTKWFDVHRVTAYKKDTRWASMAKRSRNSSISRVPNHWYLIYICVVHIT